jgi:subtilisin family serine protease
LGAEIEWAVLDTGVQADHPHFEPHSTVVAQWDCLDRGNPRQSWPWKQPRKKGTHRASLDPHGHGTHVAGIIGGAYDGMLSFANPPAYGSHRVVLAGMAPQAKIHSYRVLDPAGGGNDAAIIKALDHISTTNECAGKLQIHGVNLSLGGQFDPTMFGCGHSPLCQELRRLWRQGVVVVLAAGNSGQVRVLTGDNLLVAMNTSVSIGDPANLGDAIAVGSVHKTDPHMNGISYFSSRGPTMDGRIKPDCVAPGERVLSARASFHKTQNPTVEDLYVEMAGTSMAAPHVSGMLAAFLSIRREFIGYPDRVKGILLDNCTDLSREKYSQGRGLPNLVRMLVAT